MAGTRPALESFRRGCLKGTFYVRCGIKLCKCEMNKRPLQELQPSYA
jgi:hypothetical protein